MARGLSYDLSFKEITGKFCGNDLSESFSTEEETKSAFEDLIMDELVTDFPNPARGSIKSFIKSRIKF
ncbi:MAG: hypothetical protein ACXVCD_03730 [Pseudobdellovibrionaceae bacterium]